MTSRWQDGLDGKVAVVTGAGFDGVGHGVGSATCAGLAERGARLVLVDHDRERAGHTAALVGAEAAVVVGDAAEEATAQEAVATARERWGTVDILVNNVATSRAAAQPLHLLDAGDWDRVLAVNLRSAALMSKHAIGPMLEQRSGVVINIASVSGLVALGAPAYGASKAGLIALTRELAFLYGRSGVRANALAVGHIAGPMTGTSSGAEPPRDRRRRVAPLGVDGTPWDVAAVAVFLASPAARFVSGECIAVDGGATAIAPLAATGPLLQGDGPPDAYDPRTLGLA